MIEIRRYHPLLILYDLWNLVKGSFVFIIVFFVINTGSDSFIFKYGRIIFLLFITYSIISIILKWFTHKFKLDETTFYLYKGIFAKKERTITFSKIQNVNRRTSLFHRMFNVTSIRFETAMSGGDDAVEFEVISKAEANKIEKYVAKSGSETSVEMESDVNEFFPEVERTKEEPSLTLHFKPTKWDILKASFTSLGFLVLIPLLTSIYFKINQVFNIEEKAEGIVGAIWSSWWVVAIILIFLVIVSISFGIVRTYLKYGKYEITSDEDRIFITQGVIDETAFTISKENVQAIEITQSTMKRMLGLAEVKLISLGSLSIGDDEVEINSLYPFLPVKRAYEMVSEILPTYHVTDKMARLPKKSLWIRMFKPSWVWIIVTIALTYFKPPVFEIEQAWWMISVLLFIWVYFIRIFEYLNTRYVLYNSFIQFKTGSLSTTLFISKRDKVIELEVKQNPFQKKLDLASIELMNQASPIHHTRIEDIPLYLADSVYAWYIGRTDDVEIE